MRTYFFHIEGTERIEDEAGLRLRDDYAARAEAVSMARVLTGSMKRSASWRIVVDEQGDRITQIPIFTKAA